MNTFEFCILWSSTCNLPAANHRLYSSTKPPTRGGGRGVMPPPPTFSVTVLCQGCFPTNSLLCHSTRHPKLFLPWHSHNLVGSPDYPSLPARLELKGALPGLRQFLPFKRPLKLMKMLFPSP